LVIDRLWAGRTRSAACCSMWRRWEWPGESAPASSGEIWADAGAWAVRVLA
jgi:hypothetical protein